jgi:leader peptidase (prepilin peptidase) / N-methyltransferase
MIAIAVGALGTLIGSFLNVVVYRVPLGKSIVSPPSACGSCGHQVRGYDNIPLISWLVLRGKCRDCGSAISVRYPLVELAGALFFAAVALRFVPAITAAVSTEIAVAGILSFVAFLYLAAISIALTLIDIDTHRLPNVIVLPAYAVGAVLLGAASFIGADMASLGRAAIGAGAMGGIYLLLAVVRPGGMGIGDVKLAGVLGFFLGWLGCDVLAVGFISGFILGGLFGVALIAFRGARAKSGIPFGPWMLAGAWIGILGGQLIATAYLSLFGLGGS